MTPNVYQVLTTSRFDRDVKAVLKRNPQMLGEIESVVQSLRDDPFNISSNHNIKKLKGLKAGEGLWRMAFGDYRIRYDILGRDVVLYSCKPRRDIYRR